MSLVLYSFMHSIFQSCQFQLFQPYFTVNLSAGVCFPSKWTGYSLILSVQKSIYFGVYSRHHAVVLKEGFWDLSS